MPIDEIYRRVAMVALISAFMILVDIILVYLFVYIL
jgi:hypothetical protein